MKLILDTNAYVGFKLGYSDIVDYLTRADVILMSPVVLGELMFGFRNGSRLNSNMEELDLFLSHPAVETIHISDVSSDRYSRIALQLKQQGTHPLKRYLDCCADLGNRGVTTTRTQTVKNAGF